MAEWNAITKTWIKYPFMQAHVKKLLQVWTKISKKECVSVRVLSVSHYVPALRAISHCSVNRKIQHFLVLITLSEQMMPEIFILFIMEFQWPLLQIKWKFLHIKWEKLNVNHVLMWLRVTGTLFLLISHQHEGSNKAKAQGMFVLLLIDYKNQREKNSFNTWTFFQNVFFALPWMLQYWV